jgi:hypothetical protein
MRDPVYSRSAELMEADIGDEMVALDQRAGSCFGFNSVATEVWRRLTTPRTFEQLRDELLESYDVTPEQCTNELQALLRDLQANGLITEVG